LKFSSGTAVTGPMTSVIVAIRYPLSIPISFIREPGIRICGVSLPWVMSSRHFSLNRSRQWLASGLWDCRAFFKSESWPAAHTLPTRIQSLYSHLVTFIHSRQFSSCPITNSNNKHDILVALLRNTCLVIMFYRTPSTPFLHNSHPPIASETCPRKTESSCVLRSIFLISLGHSNNIYNCLAFWAPPAPEKAPYDLMPLE
jgi:hypothetical protein